MVAFAFTTYVNASEEAKQDGRDEPNGIVATVGDEVITLDEYQINLQAAYRQRFFHGKVPEQQQREFRQEVVDGLVERILLRKEALRRGLKPDKDWVDQQLGKVEARYQKLPRWEDQRETLVSELQAQLEAQSLVEQLRLDVESIAEPERGEVVQYYRDHPDIFTTPQRLHVSTILLKVDPWAPEITWQAAADEARRLVKKLQQDADFAELARLHSGDESAASGGDLGYIHAGMLSAEAQQVVDQLAQGKVSEPVRLLRGYALFRLEDRMPAKLNAFSHVEERARQLLVRTKKKQAWQETIDLLRKNTPITINSALVEGLNNKR